MAEVEDIFEDIWQDAKDGIDGENEDVEGDEDISEEEKEEFKKDADEAIKDIDELGDVEKKLDKVTETATKKSFVEVVKETILIGIILFGVNLVLGKLVKGLGGGGGSGGGGSGSTEGNKKKLAITKALSALIKDITSTSTSLVNWCTAKEDVFVPVGYGVKVPLPDIISEKMAPIKTNMKAALDTARTLMNSDVKPPTFNVPTNGQIQQIIDSAGKFVASMQDCISFVAKKSDHFPQLKSCPVKQSDIDKLNSDLSAIKKLPAY